MQVPVIFALGRVGRAWDVCRVGRVENVCRIWLRHQPGWCSLVRHASVPAGHGARISGHFGAKSPIRYS